MHRMQAILIKLFKHAPIYQDGTYISFYQNSQERSNSMSYPLTQGYISNAPIERKYCLFFESKSCRYSADYVLAIYEFSMHYFIIIIRKIEMGCGAVCGIQAPSPSKHPIYSKAKILQLYPKIKICKPLLTDHALLKFSQVLQSPHNEYTLKVGERVGTDEQIEPFIMQKWRIILYGLDKDDEKYKKCLSFQVRNEKQQVTNSQKLINNASLIQNKSYHELKPNTQYHQCFTQIEKDLNRTFEFKQEKKKIFENILKRISNYFPSMGYTQGVNFVVGYLLIVGYSQSDTFWMFSHLALNQRYLILGLYEDGFPLAYIYTSIFKNMLRRLDPKLHDHLYSTLMLDESMWIFKWFITYYIYSFPFNTIKYIWNLVIQLGGIALVYYALAIVTHIRDKLLQIEDPCDISQFLQGLKELNRFNELIKINQIITKVYQCKAIAQDFSEIKSQKPSIYKTYYQHFDQIMLRDQEIIDGPRKERTSAQKTSISRMIYAWYEKIMAERIEFQSNSVQKHEKHRGGNLPDILKSQYLDLQKSINILQEKILQNESMKMSKPPQPLDNFFGQLISNDPIQINLKDQQQLPLQISDLEHRSKNITKMSYDMQEEINEVDGQSDSNNEEIEENSYQNNEIERPAQSIDVDDDIFQKIKKESPNGNFQLKVNTIVGQVDNRKKTLRQANSKANNIRITQQKRTGLALAAQNILCNLSVTNSQYSSNSSKNTSFKPKRHKQNNLFRYNKNGKVRTEEMSQPSMDPSSSRGSSVTDKESFSGMTHRENPSDERPSMIINDRRTQQQFMISSQGPQKLNDQGNFSKEMTSQIQIFNGEHLFKKKKKIYNRNSNIISINQNIGKSTQKIDEIQCYSKRTLNERNKNYGHREQQSIDAIIYSLSTRKTSQQHQKQIDAMIYEIESIK